MVSAHMSGDDKGATAQPYDALPLSPIDGETDAGPGRVLYGCGRRYLPGQSLTKGPIYAPAGIQLDSGTGIFPVLQVNRSLPPSASANLLYRLRWKGV